jgi:hypothetical protein
VKNARSSATLIGGKTLIGSKSTQLTERRLTGGQALP